MARKRIAKVWDVPFGGIVPLLGVIGACFLAGGLAGCFFAASLQGGGGEELAAYIRAYLEAARAGLTRAPELLPLIWQLARWPLLIVLFGFTALGVVGIPALIAVRGFLLSFAVASFIRVLGPAGGVVAFLLFGLCGCLEIPALFTLGVHGLKSSCSLSGRTQREGARRYAALFERAALLRYGICAGALTLCVVLEWVVIPVLLSMVMGGLSF